MLYPDTPLQSPAFSPALETKSPEAALQREYECAGAAAALPGIDCFIHDEHRGAADNVDGETHGPVNEDDDDAFADDALLLAFKVRGPH